MSLCVSRFLRNRKGSAAGGLQLLVGRKPGDRWLPSCEGRCLHSCKGRWSCTTLLVNTFIRHAHLSIGTCKAALGASSEEASGDLVSTCLPSRLSRVRAPSPAPTYRPSLCRPITSRLGATRQRYGKQGGGLSMCKQACSDTLPRFRVTSCLRKFATPCPAVSLPGRLPAHQRPKGDHYP
jgi:hypothetical protein